MEIWYKAENYYNCSIEPVEVVKETEHTVTTLRGDRVRKESNHHRLFSEWGPAKLFLMLEAQKEIEQAKARLLRSEKKLENVSNMSEPIK